jgi:cell division protein FtsQ
MTMRENQRLRRRRIDVTRSVGRRRLRRLVVLMTLSTVALGTVFALRSAMFDVDHVEVQGAVRTDEGDLVAASGIELGEAMLNLDVASARRSIAQMPYVASVSVRRDWPNKARIEIVEREPLYEVSSAGRFATVSDDGVVVEIHEEPTGLPAVRGGTGIVALAVGDPFDASEEVGVLIEAIGPNLSRWVDGVELRSGRGLVLNLVGDAEVLLGSIADVDQKLIGLSTVLGRAELSCVEEIDVRIADSPVVRRGCV